MVARQFVLRGGSERVSSHRFTGQQKFFSSLFKNFSLAEASGLLPDSQGDGARGEIACGLVNNENATTASFFKP